MPVADPPNPEPRTRNPEPEPRPAFKRWVTLLATVLAVGFTLLVLSTGELVRLGPPFELSDRLADLTLERGDDGATLVVLDTETGTARVPAEEFLARVAEKQKSNRHRGFLYRLFDITAWTGILWVGFGFGGQALFTGRMLLQWLASEKEKRSVVPVAFWWMSLTGSTMLMMYFIWRVEIVGVIGQSTGWFVYARNLVLIYRPKAPPDAPVTTPVEDPAPEPVGATDGGSGRPA